jgi:hypothetical protein
MIDTLKSKLLAGLPRNEPSQEVNQGKTLVNCRPDETAWAIMALQASGASATNLHPARSHLVALQQSDGRVSLSPEHPEAWWPTPLAILAWHQVPEFHISQIQAVKFLLETTGSHSPKEKDAFFDHDPSIRGWPWIENTHSWVIPSSLAVIALKTMGYSDHERVQEATRLLLDRQLSPGGWNYGNTKVYGQVLQPMVMSTGVALSALAGSVPRQEVEPSLVYLNKQSTQVRTPMSLSWSLLGLGAWGEAPPERAAWLEACWRQKERYRGYDTVALSLMMLALALPEGILSLFGSAGIKIPA